MNDLIHRQDAIDVVGYEIDDGYNAIVDRINSLPSAGQNCILCEYYTEIEKDDGIKGKCTRRTGSDLISRQAVIELIKCSYYDLAGSMDDVWSMVAEVESLPSADIEEDVARRIATIIENEQDMRVILKNAEPLVLTCDGCRHVGTYDTDFPCSSCIRREKDYYEQER